MLGTIRAATKGSATSDFCVAAVRRGDRTQQSTRLGGPQSPATVLHITSAGAYGSTCSAYVCTRQSNYNRHIRAPRPRQLLRANPRTHEPTQPTFTYLCRSFASASSSSSTSSPTISAWTPPSHRTPPVLPRPSLIDPRPSIAAAC
ncbi:hypothetical protein BST61_g6489 [Cercospora zeina]